jgi:hypothetical protein
MLTPYEEYGCDVVLGALGRKCSRCRDGKHYCVPVEQPLFELLKKVKTARAAYTTAVRAVDDQEEINERKARARDLTDELIAGLKTLNNNRNKTEGDRVAGRKRRAGGSNTTSSDPMVIAELQSIRRGILALVEVGKAVSSFPASPFPSEAHANRMRSTCVTAPSLRRRSTRSTRSLGLMPLRRRRRMGSRMRRWRMMRMSSVEHLLRMCGPCALHDTLALLCRGATPK